MLNEGTNWPRLYTIAGILGAGFGLLAGLGVLPSAPDWPAVLSIAGGSLVGLVLAAAAHLGVRLHLRHRPPRGPAA